MSFVLGFILQGSDAMVYNRNRKIDMDLQLAANPDAV